MTPTEKSTRPPLLDVAQHAGARLAQGVVVATALAAVAACCAAVLGRLPWLVLPLSLDGTGSVDAGPWVQGALSVLLVALCFLIPGSVRVLRLETSHRRFHATMEDVARAFYAAHAADRRGVFRFRNEFDAVRERLRFLRDHPDLGELDPEVLELAAQMSHVGRDLARVYSVEKIEEARATLTRRGDQAARLEAEIDRISCALASIRARLEAVAAREERATERIAALRDEVEALLVGLDMATDATKHEDRSSTGEGTGRIMSIIAAG